MPEDRGGSFSSPARRDDEVNTAALPVLSLVDLPGTYQCDCCLQFYAYDGVMLGRQTSTSAGYQRVATLCRRCLLKLGISIMERELG